MLKNKKTLYILVPLVVLIWGMIGFRIWAGFNNDTTNYLLEPTYSEPITEILAVDTFSIIANYRDPFLGKIQAPKPKPIKTKKKPTPVIKKLEPILRWPTIIYGGMIKNQKTSKLIAMIKINGRDNLMSVGNVVSEVRLVKVYPDSIEVALGKAEKVVLK